VDEQLHGAGRLAHRHRDVLDPHVLLELEDHRRALRGGKGFDHGPDPAQLVAPSGLRVQLRLARRQVTDLVDVRGRAGGSIPVGDRVDGDLVEPGREGTPGVLVPGQALQGLHENLRGDVFRSALLPYSRKHEPVDLLEVAVVQLPERVRVLLRPLDQLLVAPRRQAAHPATR
jgi:hypothetical protein